MIDGPLIPDGISSAEGKENPITVHSKVPGYALGV